MTNMTNKNNFTAEDLSRETKYKIINTKDAYLWKKPEGEDIPVEYLDKLKELYLSSASDIKIDLINNAKETK